MILRHEINSTNRQYYIERVNEPIVRAVGVFNKGVWWLSMLLALIEIVRDIRKYPTPTLENVKNPNSKWLLLKLERYLEYEQFGRISKVVEVFITGLVVKNEHSPNYRDRISFWYEDNEGWKPRSHNHPVNGWKEPKPYGTLRS